MKKRIGLGIVLLVVELFLFFGTGVLGGEETHFLTGEGAWNHELTSTQKELRQEFRPVYKHLQKISFCMEMTHAVHGNGTVWCRVEDDSANVIFEKGIPFYDVEDSSFTDVEMNIDLATGKNYYLILAADTVYAEEMPYVRVCGTEYTMRENQALYVGQEPAQGQLVSRYVYRDAVTGSHARNAIVLCVLTMLGVILPIPKKKYLRQIVSVAILLVAPYILGSRLELFVFDASFYLPFSLKWNVGIMYVLALVVLLMTHSVIFTTIFTNGFLTVLYSANYFMRMYRGTSLRVNDFTAIGTAAEVVGDYDLTPNSHMAMAWAILLLFIVWSLACYERKHIVKNKYVQIASYVITITVALCILRFGSYKLWETDYLSDHGFVDKGMQGFEHELIYAYDGYLVATCIEIKNSKITPPVDYSVKTVEALLQNAKDSAEERNADVNESTKPHVILIMNESLADLSIFDSVNLNQDNMPFLRSMKENTIKGFVNTSVFGGGTANSEFEVFTGCTMSFFSVNYYPYQQAITKPMNSMVSQMKNLGYTTIAMHPERSGNWNRENVYKYYGFDQCYFKPDFGEAKIIHSGVSDAETYHKVIELYENRGEDEKLFVFDLTMQNHGGYDMDEAPYAIQDLNRNDEPLNQYLSLVQISDQAFEELIHYFEQVDEPVLICMYGDHQPSVSNVLVNDGSEEMLKKFKTPFVIWANFEVAEAENMDLSLNYLGGLVMRTAGLPLSPYFTYLEQLREQYPIITPNGFVDANGTYGSFSGDNTELLDYRMLQYNYLFDRDTVKWGY